MLESQSLLLSVLVSRKEFVNCSNNTITPMRIAKGDRHHPVDIFLIFDLRRGFPSNVRRCIANSEYR